jgi:hypothetical protein
MDAEYKKLVRWLMKYDKNNLTLNAYLVVSNKLLAEYHRTVSSARLSTNITFIIDKLTREGRLVKYRNQEIKEFQRKKFKKTIVKKLRSNKKDHDHIPVVLLSDRKYALSIDDNFIYDLENFPGFTVRAEKRPERLPYDK